MLNRTPKPRTREGNVRKRWHDSVQNIPSLGCSVCPDRGVCGGLRVAEPLFWCLDYCCGKPDSCDVVCRNNSKFVDYVREINGFAFDTSAPLPRLTKPILPASVPLVFHGNSRADELDVEAAALPFARMFDHRNGNPKYETRDQLRSAFRLAPRTKILLSGTDKDWPIERWWHLGRERRVRILRTLKRLDVSLVTSPNYSLFIDQPRWDDLHAMKRISLVHSEMLNEGIATALHINGRTETDFHRWAEYLKKRSEIEFVAYEFATGTRWVDRRELHITWLASLAEEVGRPLDLIVRGGGEILPRLRRVFSQVVFIDTTSFMKTVKRRRAVLTEGGRMVWRPWPTKPDAPLDDLLNCNSATVATWIANQVA